MALGLGDAASPTASSVHVLGEQARIHLELAHRSRESGLRHCRSVIRACGMAIRAVHRQDRERYAELVSEAGRELRAAQSALDAYPRVRHAGFLHDAEKEYVEARLTAAFVDGDELAGPDALGVEVPAWLNGMAEAASELRRYLLDRLREGKLPEAESLLRSMEEVYDLLVTLDYPDALTGGLRRATDALRAVLERSRADVTTTVLQARLQRALESRGI